MPNIQINWYWMDDFTVNATVAEIREQAKEAMRKAGSGPVKNFGQAVYVIRTKKPFAIQYPIKHSPTIYIGEGSLISRLDKHRGWLKRFQQQGHEFEFEVAFCLPRLPGNRNAYRDYEAYLLGRFREKYGTLPLRNRQNENASYEHKYNHTENAIGPTRGVRYQWAIRPLKSNLFMSFFLNTGIKVQDTRN